MKSTIESGNSDECTPQQANAEVCLLYLLLEGAYRVRVEVSEHQPSGRSYARRTIGLQEDGGVLSTRQEFLKPHDEATMLGTQDWSFKMPLPSLSQAKKFCLTGDRQNFLLKSLYLIAHQVVHCLI